MNLIVTEYRIMGGYTGLVRIIRRRLVLGLIFTLSLTYCAFSLFRNERKSTELDGDLDDMEAMIINDNNDDMISDDDVPSQQLKASGKPQSWGMDVPNEGGNENALGIDSPSNLNDSDTSDRPCRNSVQGKVLIVDEHGVVCARHELLSNGCCSREQKQPSKAEETVVTAVLKERYSCKTCNAQGCCAIYEYCVSCCLHPAKHIKGKKDIVESGKNHQRIKEDDAVKVRLRNMDRFQTCLAACRTSSASVRHENTYKDPHSKHCYAVQPPYNHQRHRRDIKSLNNNRDNDGVVVASSSVVQLITPD
ncbi:SREBP regulating protein isoform X1 [Vespula maculifrons]|uniref:SREBP regulating gene protein n=1 Tax=Vespula maculifrons TaxID=7453 RepID=A0ABD2CTC6_VESMC